MSDPELPFNRDSVARFIASPRYPDPEVIALTKLGYWGLAHLSSTLPIESRPRLVGRELESVRMLHAIDAVAREDAAVVATIAGVAGSGKTRFIEELMTVAEAAGFDGRVLSVTAAPGDGAYAVVKRLLCQRFALSNKSEGYKRDCLLRRVGQLFPDQRVDDVCYFIGRLVGVELEASPLARMITQQKLQEELALQTLMGELFAADSAIAPLCLVIEDLQHADRESLGVLASLADELPAGTLLVLSGNLEFFTKNELFAERGAGVREHIELGPLEPSDTRTLLSQLIGPCDRGARELEDYVLAEGLGNPGLIHELVRELWATGALREEAGGVSCSFEPQRLSRDAVDRGTVEVRLSCMPSLLLAVLETGALTGSACWASLWPALLRTTSPDVEVDEAQVARALADLEQRGHLLRLPDSRIEGDVEYIFRDASARERLADQVAPRWRGELHRTVAEFLSSNERAIEESSDMFALLGHHLLKSGSAFRAALSYAKAARLARRERATLQACSHFELCLRALGQHDNRRRLELLNEYGEALVDLGRTSQARRAFREMASLAERLACKAKRGVALHRLGRIQREAGELSEAERTFVDALGAFADAQDPPGLAATKDDLGQVLWLRGERERAVMLLHEALETRRALGDPSTLALSLSKLAVVWDGQGKRGTSDRALDMAVGIIETSDELAARCDACLARGAVANHRHDLAAALASLRTATELSYTAKDRPRFAKSLVQLGLAELRNHDFAKAEELLIRGTHLAAEIECYLDVVDGERGLAKLALRRGHSHAARGHVCAALRLARRFRSPALLAAALRTLAEVIGDSEQRAIADRAVGYYMRSIDIAKSLGDERELAKGYRSFARYAERFESTEIRRQSRILRGLSDDLFRRFEARPAA